MNSNREFRLYRPFWILIPIIFVVGILSIFATAYFFGPFSAGTYPQFYYFPFWIIFPLFFFGFFFAFRWLGWGCWWGSRSYYYNDHALEVLRERFARGEISKEQYEQMRKDLEAPY